MQALSVNNPNLPKEKYEFDFFLVRDDHRLGFVNFGNVTGTHMLSLNSDELLTASAMQSLLVQDDGHAFKAWVVE